MPAWTVTESSTSTTIERGVCPTCSKPFSIIFDTSSVAILAVKYDADENGKLLQGKSLRSAGGNMSNWECPYCGSTVLASNS